MLDYYTDFLWTESPWLRSPYVRSLYLLISVSLEKQGFQGIWVRIKRGGTLWNYSTKQGYKRFVPPETTQQKAKSETENWKKKKISAL